MSKRRGRKSSAEIVQEARLSLRLSEKQLARSISTKRPETPADVRFSGKQRKIGSQEKFQNFEKLNWWNSENETVDELLVVSLDKRNQPRRLRPLSSLKTSVTCLEADNQNSSCNFLLRPESAHSLESLSPSKADDSIRSVESGYSSRPSSSVYSELDLSVFSKDLRGCLEKLSPFTKDVSDTSESDISTTVEDLHEILKNKGLLENKKWRGRTPVLKALFGALTPHQPAASIKIATICLALRVSGHNLTSLLVFLRDLCEFLQQTSATTGNTLSVQTDKDFLKELLGLCEHLYLPTDAEEIVCILETLTCIASKVQEAAYQLLDQGIIRIIYQWWTQLRSTYQNNEKTTWRKEILQQSSMLMRSQLELGRKCRIQILEFQYSPLFAEFLHTYRKDKDTLLQLLRILSVLSLNEEFCENLLAAKPDILHSFSVFLRQYFRDENVTVRLLFVAGNFLSVSEKAQWNLHLQPDIYTSLLCIFQHYLEPLQSKKLVRLLGNMSVHSGVGPSLCLNEELLKYLLAVLDLRRESENEELVLNTLTTLHNLSFYRVDGNVVEQDQVKVAESVYPCLMDPYRLRVVIEASNVLGNLSRYTKAQQWLFERKVHVMLISLLDSSSSELLSSACGILINLTLTREGCSHVKKNNADLGKRLLNNVLCSNAGKNWTVCTLGCKLFWNLAAFDCVAFDVSQKLIEWLLKNTDESAVISQKSLPDDLNRQIKNLWEDEFSPIATELLAHLSSGKQNCKNEVLE